MNASLDQFGLTLGDTLDGRVSQIGQWHVPTA